MMMIIIIAIIIIILLIIIIINIYYREFYSEPFVTLAYLKPWHFQNPRYIHDTVKHLSRNI